MKKADKKLLDESLNKALAPRRPKRDLSDILDEYDDDKTATPAEETRLTRVTPVTRTTRVSRDAAPARDFTRTANSIVREAVPSGVFTGKGKQLYDYLYSQTRGAVVPVRSVRLPRATVMRGADMSRPTYRTQLARLLAAGLVKVEEMGGEHDGNLYTVFLPEELANPGYPGYPGKKLDGLPGQETYPGNPGLSADFQRTSDGSKTLIQDLKSNDDEAAPLTDALKRAERELTGKVTADASKWEELASVLVTELKIAAGRTTVSSAPAFLAEHLRRRLWKKEKRQLDAETASEGKSARGEALVKNPADCPDCFGAGMYYPEGFERGVARCQHLKLSKSEEGT